ncbi:Mur ligase family protein [Candidatus Cytomitobacter indipagum]|nr:UDP-N-acetylmuramoyl-L-alanyl-D-glutamate--2,6-diaminopimelate ligase [Candidatus Cytomitobacter indipagum]
MTKSIKEILRFKNLHSKDLTTCYAENNMQIKSISKYKDKCKESDWFLDIANKQIVQKKYHLKELLKSLKEHLEDDAKKESESEIVNEFRDDAKKESEDGIKDELRDDSKLKYDEKDKLEYNSKRQKNCINNINDERDSEEKSSVDSNYFGEIDAPFPRKTWSELSSIAFPEQPNFIALITGTDGKTSTAWITYQIWQFLGIKSGYIGTLGIYINNKKYKSDLTTPDASALHYYLDKMKKAHVNHVAIEASSIGLDQDRLAFVKANVAVFTSFGSDHLDYHKTIDQYLKAKLKIIDNMKSDGLFLAHHSIENYIESMNNDHVCHKNYASKEFRNSAAEKFFNQKENYKSEKYGKEHSYSDGKWIFNLNGEKYEVSNKLIGGFNGENMTAAIMTIKHGIEQNEKMKNYLKSKHYDSINHAIIMQLNKIHPVPGRLNLVNHVHNCDIYVDFAHTADSLNKTLQTLKQHYKEVCLVFGCGGDRDKSKRSKMGEVAHKLADSIIITNDNPRSENPNAIASEILSSCPNAKIILDRKKAIKYSILRAIKSNKNQNDLNNKMQTNANNEVQINEKAHTSEEIGIDKSENHNNKSSNDNNSNSFYRIFCKLKSFIINTKVNKNIPENHDINANYIYSDSDKNNIINNPDSRDCCKTSHKSKHSVSNSKSDNKSCNKKNEKYSTKVILIAGKGDERTQTFHNHVENFYDADVINQLIEEISSNK